MTVRISGNGRFLARDDGAPFFYLADTAWELIHRLTLAEADHYLRDRAAKGFTVIQTVVLAEQDGLKVPNRNGDLPLVDEDPRQPNEAYFRHVDAVVDLAASYGLHLGLLPTWGDKWNLKWGSGPEIFDAGSAKSFGRFLGERYADAPLVWILGGDRPVETDEHREILRGFARGLRDGDGGSHLITMHTWGQHSSSEFVGGEEWVDFHMVQSGHARNFENWRLIERDYALDPPIPCMDAEPAYELSVEGITRIENGLIDAYDVRKAMYWSLFAGAHGHTYGCWPVWQMYDVGRPVPFLDFVASTWREALDAPGSSQVRHAADLVLSRPYFERIPDQALVVGEAGEGVFHVRATRDLAGSYALIYFPTFKAATIDLTVLAAERLVAWWFDPRTGVSRAIGEIPRAVQEIAPPMTGPDWILVVDDAGRAYRAPGTPGPPAGGASGSN